MPASKPLRLTLIVESLNAGMRTRDDVAACLEDAAAKLREFSCTPQHISASLRDVNGNTVGHLTLVDAVEPGEDVDDDDAFACLDCGENGRGVHACPGRSGDHDEGTDAY